MLTEEMSSVLQYCNSLRTLNEHVRYISEKEWDKPELLHSLLSELVHLELLQSANTIIQTAIEQIEDIEIPSISTISVITSDRPQMLHRNLKNIITHNKLHNRYPIYLVLDDSSSDLRQKENLDIIKSVIHKTGAIIRYADIEEKQKLIKALKNAGNKDNIPESILNFALGSNADFDRTVGANRNHFLLATLGEQAMMVDDDVFCELAQKESGDEILEICGLRDPTNILTYPSREELFNDILTTDANILTCHEKLLGRSIGSLFKDEVNLESITPQSADTLMQRGSRVVATLPGFYGDSGMANSRWVFLLRGDYRAEIFDSRHRYHTACRSREIIRSVNRYTISTTSSMQTHQIAVDNRVLLPPFFPILRNQDGLFAVTLRACLPSGFIGHIPQAVLHAPEIRRTYGRDSLTSFSPRMTEYLILIISVCQKNIRGNSAEDRLSSLGRQISEIADLSLSSFKEFLQVHWTHHLNLYTGYLDNLLFTYSYSPKYWASDVNEHLDSCKTFIMNGGIPAPADILPGKPGEEPMRMCQTLTARFGELLTWWPVITRAAKNLHSEKIFPLKIIS
jgi:hypothetical protein